ncbi:MAG: hypothetical protein HY323_05365 [Betaproteobacteria bacterium]|nr:hypothetical protein [Betaproteobacteria bacterium]
MSTVDTAEPRQELALRSQAELTVEQVVAQVQKIQQVQRAVMKDGEHFGVIPGATKPSLLKPGAEKLCETFRLAPRYRAEKQAHPDGHLDVFVTCELTHIPTGLFFGEGLGACTTRETKYAYRQAERTCPKCSKPAIIKGKAEYGGGWLCFKKKNGCGAKFADDAPEIVSQEGGRIPNDALADAWNTVVKMAKKRALVDAVLTATAASDIFTQDLEDTGKADIGSAATASTPATGGPAVESAVADAPSDEVKKRRRQAHALISKLVKAGSAPQIDEEAINHGMTAEYGTARVADLTYAQLLNLIERLSAKEQELGL